MSDTTHKIALILEMTDAKLRAGVAAVTRVLGDLEKGAKAVAGRAGDAMEGFEDRTKEALGKVAGDTGGAAKALQGLENKAKSAAAGAAGAVEGFEKRTKSALGRVGASTGGVGRFFEDMRREATGAVNSAGDAVEGFEKRTGGVLSRLLGPLADFQGQIAAAFGVAGLGAAVNEAATFERALADVATLLDGTGVSLARYKEQLIDLAGRSSRDLLDLTKGLYDTLSSGIPAVEGASGAFAVLEASAKAAAAGNAETADVIRTVTATLNAYKGSGLTAAQVTDKLRVAVDKGVTTMPELAGSLGQILGIASGFKISFDEVLAVITQLTLAGFSSSEAITSLRQALVTTANAENQANVAERMNALGFSMNLAKLESQGFIGVLEEMKAKTGATGEVINSLYTDIDGKKAVLALAAQGFDQLRGNMEAMRNASGATDRAAKIVSATFDEQWKVLKNKLTIAMISIGQRALPALTRGMESLAGILESGNLVENLGTLAAALANIASFVVSHGQGIIAFLTTLAAFKIGSAAFAGIDALKTRLMSLVSTGGTVAQTAARFGQDYALNYGTGFAKGVKASAGGIGASLKGALKSPAMLGVIVAAGTELGQLLGDWIGKALVNSSPIFGQKAQELIRANTKDLDQRAQKIALDAGFRDADELRAIQEKLAKGQALLLKGQNQVVNPGSDKAKLGFRVEDVRDLSEAFKGSALEAQAAAAEAKATIEAQIGNLENEKIQVDAQMQALRATAADAKARSEQFGRDANNSLEGFAALVVEGNAPAREAVDAGEKLKLLEERALDVSRRLIDAKRNQAAFATGVLQSEQEAAAAADQAEASTKERVAAKREEQKAARDAARDAKREADQARRERERETADALRDLGKLQSDALTAEGQAGLNFLESAIDAQEQAIAQAKALNEATLADLDRAGASIEDMAIAEQRGLEGVQNLLREQIGLVEALRIKREKAAELAGVAEVNAAREAAAERAKYLSPDAKRQQAEELKRLETAAELQTAAEITKIRTDSAKQVFDIEAKIRTERAAAEKAFQVQIAEGTQRAMRQTGFAPTPDEAPTPKAAAALRGLIGTIWEELVDGGKTAAEGLAEKLSGFVAGAINAELGEGTSGAIALAFSNARDSIVSGGEKAAQWLRSGAEAATAKVLTASQSLLGNDLFARIAGAVGRVGSAAGTLLKSAAAQTAAAVRVAAEVPGKLVDATEQLVGGLSDAFGALGEDASEKLGEALVNFGTTINSVLTAPLKELLGEDLSRYLSPILDLPGALLKQVNSKILQPALSAATSPLDRLFGAANEALSALTNPENTQAALKEKLAAVDAETKKRVDELNARGQFSEAKKAQAEGATQKDEIQREFDKAQPAAVLGRMVDQANEVLQRVVQALPALVGTIVDTLIQELPKFIEGLANAVAGVLTTLAPKIGPLLTTVINAILDAVPVIIDALVQAIPQIVDGVLKALIGLIGRLPALLTIILQGIIDLLPGLFKALADNIPGLIIAIIDAIPKLIVALADAIPVIITEVIAGVGDIIGAIIEHLPEIIVSIVKALPQIVWALIKLVPMIVWALVKGLGLALASIFRGFGGAFAKMGAGIASAGKAFGKGVSEAARAVWKWLTSAGRAFYDFVTAAGRAAKSGAGTVWGGIKSGASWVKENTWDRIFHSGGHVSSGADPAKAIRWAAAGVRRFADGGFVGSMENGLRRQLRGDEVPALLQLDESVLNRVATRNMGQAELNARNAGWTPSGGGGGGPVIAQITPSQRGLDALLQMLIGQIVLTAGQPGSPMNRVLDRRPVPGARGLR